MSTNVVFNGVTYSIPAEGDEGWGSDLSSYLISLASNTFQRSGGTFTMTSETNFGTGYGFKLPYIKSQATNPSATGIIRLGNTETISWRNAANSADLALTVTSGNALQFNGSSVVYSGSITNADISASAAIALSKLAALATDFALISSGSGVVSVSSVTATELGYLSGVTSAVQTQLDAKEPSLSAGTTSQYYRGDKTWQTLDKTAVGLANVDNTSDATKNSASATLTNKTINGSNNTITNVSLTTGVTGTLPAGNGGTGLTSPGASGNVLTSNGLDWVSSSPASAPLTSFELSNLGISVSVAANALTIALKQSDGSTDPSSGSSSVKIGFRSSTAANGSFNQRSVTSSLSLTVPSGATLGSGNSLEHNYYIYALDNAGTVELAVSMARFEEDSVQSTTVMNTSSDSNSVMYSTTARSNVPIRIIGMFTATEATAGTWATSPSLVAVTPPNGFKPFPVCAIYKTNAGQSFANNTEAIVDYGTREDDTCNMVTTGASWQCKVNEAGRYSVNAAVGMLLNAVTVNFSVISLWVNGSIVCYGTQFSGVTASSSGAEISWQVGRTLKLAKDDYVQIKFLQNVGASRTLDTSAATNYFSLVKIS